jgi:TAG lipase/steryl ester hydrolase/phospholipase A2/LPA acyltransferase
VSRLVVVTHLCRRCLAGWELNPLTKLIHFTKAELKHYAQNVAAVGLPGPISSVLSIFTQKYEGDITIKPLSLQLKSFQGLLSNPTSARVAAAIREGELETWKHLSIIKNHCDIEFTINECIGTIKSQLQGTLLFLLHRPSIPSH